MKAQIQRLSSEHDRTQFDCGEAALNLWLAEQSLGGAENFAKVCGARCAELWSRAKGLAPDGLPVEP